MNYNTIIFKFFIQNTENILTSIKDVEGEPFSLIHVTDKRKIYKNEIKQIIINNELMEKKDDLLINNTHINHIFIDNNITINITILKGNNIQKYNYNIRCHFSRNIMFLLLLCVFFLPILLIIFSNSLLLNLVVIWLISLIGFVFFILSIFYYESTLEIEDDNKRLKEINNMKSIFLANISHELKTPLSNIIGLSELLLDKTDNIIIEEEYIFMKDIKISAESIYKLINDILIFSKSISGNIELEYIDFDLDKLLFDIFSLLTIKIKEKNIKIHINNKNINEYSFPHILKGDPTKIKHIILNLLTNAIKFSYDDKDIDIIIDFKLIPPLNRKMNFMISIIDEGIGIENDKIEKIFIPFQQADISTTRKYGGTGLGLSICNQLVNQMKGNLKVQSKINEGSKFSFNIPLNVSKNIKENKNILININNIKSDVYNYKNLINNEIIIEEKKEIIINIIKSPIAIIKEKIKELEHINVLIATDKITSKLIKIFLNFENITINIKDDNEKYKDINLLFINLQNKNIHKKLIKHNNNMKIILINNKNKNVNLGIEDLIINIPINPFNFYTNLYKLLK